MINLARHLFHVLKLASAWQGVAGCGRVWQGLAGFGRAAIEIPAQRLCSLI